MALRSFGSGKASRVGVVFFRPRVEVLEDRMLLSFISAASYPTGFEPQFVAPGDFNGDSAQDLAVANYGSGTVSILLGNGNGTFQARHDFPAGTNPDVIGVADFNGGGKLDLAIAGYDSSGTVTILLGNGDGTFQAPRGFTTGSSVSFLAVGDFNGDGKPDLAVTHDSLGTVSVLLGNGDGTFQAPVSYAVGADPVCVSVDDVIGDGIPDLVTTNYNSATVSVLLGKGDGSFQPAINSPTIRGPVTGAVGDVNGDGIPDLALATSNSIEVLLGNGDGTFRAPTFYPDYVNNLAVAIGDFSGDGTPDIAATNDSDTLNVFAGNGDGTFQAPLQYSVGDRAVAATVGEFNGDGAPDLALANSFSNDVSVLLGRPGGILQAARNYPATLANAPVSVAVGDFNRDGIPDLLTNGAVFLGNGDGTFRDGVRYPDGGAAVDAAAGDFNGDGIPDLALVYGDAYGTLGILLGNGDGTFQAPVYYQTGFSTYPHSVAVADFNGDGKADVVLADYGSPFNGGGVTVLLGNGDGTFQPSATYLGGYNCRAVAVGDFNGEGIPDLAVPTYDDNSYGAVHILLGNGDGTFRAGSSGLVGTYPSSVVVGDFRNDGRSDLAVTNAGSNTVSVLLGNGNGSFQAAVSYPVGVSPQSVAAGDFNGDDYADLAVANEGDPRGPYGTPGSVSVLLSNGDGSFQSATTYDVGGQKFGVAVGNFDGDRNPDLAVADRTSGVTVLLNAEDWPRVPHPQPLPAPVSVHGTTSPSNTAPPFIPTPSQPADPIEQVPSTLPSGPPAPSEAISPLLHLVPALQAPAAVFGGWDDALQDVLATDMGQQFG